MTPRLRDTALLLGALLLSGAAAGCGIVRNVLVSHDDGGAGAGPGSSGGDTMQFTDAGLSGRPGQGGATAQGGQSSAGAGGATSVSSDASGLVSPGSDAAARDCRLPSWMSEAKPPPDCPS